VNCLGGFLTSREVIEAMVANKKGTVLFTGATASLRGSKGLCSFACGKFGLRALAQCMARQYGPLGVHVAHVIVDGAVDTPLLRSYFKKKLKKDPPLSSFLNPQAIAQQYWNLHQQHHTCWTQELDIRPAVEPIYSRM